MAEPVDIGVSKAASSAVLETTKKGQKKRSSIYSSSLLSRELVVPFRNVGKDLRMVLEKMLKNNFEGKCGPEGFVRPGSVRILTHTAGIVKPNGVLFAVGFECLICNPVEGMHIRCTVQNITKAGIRADIDDVVSPVVVFVARDHHFMNPALANIKEQDHITIRVIGQRFELNDKYVSIIGQLVDARQRRAPAKQTLKIVE